MTERSGSTISATDAGAAEVYVRPRGATLGAHDSKKLADALAQLGTALRQPFHDFIARMAATQPGQQGGPSEIEVKFGLVFEGGANWLVVSFSGEANLDVTLTWKRA